MSLARLLARRRSQAREAAGRRAGGGVVFRQARTPEAARKQREELARRAGLAEARQRERERERKKAQIVAPAKAKATEERKKQAAINQVQAALNRGVVVRGRTAVGGPPKPRKKSLPPGANIRTAPIGTDTEVSTGVVQPSIATRSKVAAEIPELVETPQAILPYEEGSIPEAIREGLGIPTPKDIRITPEGEVVLLGDASTVEQPGGGFSFKGGNEIIFGLAILFLIVVVTSMAGK